LRHLFPRQAWPEGEALKGPIPFAKPNQAARDKSASEIVSIFGLALDTKNHFFARDRIFNHTT